MVRFGRNKQNNFHGIRGTGRNKQFLVSHLAPPPPPQRHIKSIDDMSMKVLIDQPLGVTSSGNGWFVIGGTRMQLMIHTLLRGPGLNHG